jgi:hypothetical protein
VSKVIEIMVSPTGETQVQTKGFSGHTCRDATRFLEQALGTKKNEKLTEEFYRTNTQQQMNSQEN